ncbi:MAG: hypothetical protein IKY97_02820 [Mailhella sp.]|nr:hypothetical protein [Mailhella sp.]
MRYELYLFLVEEFYQAYNAALVLKSREVKPYTYESLQAFDVLSITAEISSKFQAAFPLGTFYGPGEGQEGWEFRTDKGLLWHILPQKVDAKPLDGFPSGYGHLIRIELDWYHAATFLPTLVDIACRNGFSLVDLQKEDLLLWSPQMFGHTGPLQCRERAGQLSDALSRKLKGVRAIAKIGEWTSYMGRKNFTRPVGNVAYAVCLVRKSRFGSASLEDWAREFRGHLESLLLSGEKLGFYARSFWVGSDSAKYNISFCIEAYGKHPSLTIHMDADKEDFEKGEPRALKVEPLCRAGALQLKKMASRLCQGSLRDSSITRRLGLRMLEELWPDPGKRFAESVRIEKQLQNIGMELGYDSVEQAQRSQIIMADVEFSTMGEQRDDTAALYMGEATFGLLYPSIRKGVSGGIQYYSFLNMVSPMQCGLIAADLKRLAWLIAHAPESPEVEEYLGSVWIDDFEPEDESTFILWDDRAVHMERNRARLIKYRKRILALFTFVIEWLSVRADGEDSADRAVNIMGL